ncbi:MAG: hypothetical protein ACRCUJ_01635 [Phocaeicola sp.]
MKTLTNQVIEHFRALGTKLGNEVATVLEQGLTEQEVFKTYVVECAEENRNEEIYYACRDAARFIAGKLSVTELLPGVHFEVHVGVEGESIESYEMITISKRELASILNRLDRLEKRVGLDKATKAKKKKIKMVSVDEPLYMDMPAQYSPDEYIQRKDAPKALHIPETTLDRYARQREFITYRDGSKSFYKKSEVLGCDAVKYRTAKQKKIGGKHE